MRDIYKSKEELIKELKGLRKEVAELKASNKMLEVDIIHCRKSEDEMKATNRRLQTLIDTVTDLVYFKDTGGTNILVNRAYEEFVGLRKEEILGKTDKEVLPEGIYESCLQSDREVIQSRKTLRFEEVFTNKDGSKRFFETIKAPLYDEYERLLGLVGISRDITEYKKAEEALLKKNEELRVLNQELHNLTIELTNLEEKERRRFAEMIHNDIGQNLTAINIFFSNLIKDPSIKEKARDNICALRSMLDEAIQSARTMTAEFYTPLLDETSLWDAIKGFVKTVMEPRGIVVSFDLGECIENTEMTSKGIVFRIIRESLQNIVKHASATRAEIKCTGDNKLTRIVVKDNGVGFNYSDIIGKPGRGIGLMLMRGWTKSLNGNIHIMSQTGKGTEIVVELPGGVCKGKGKKSVNTLLLLC